MISTVHFVRSGVSATRSPSTTATQRARRSRRARSHRSMRVLPPSIIGWLYAMCSTVPRRCRQPRTPFGGDSPLRRARGIAVEEESVDDRPSTTDVCAEGAERHELSRQWGRYEVVRRQRHEVAGTVDAFRRTEQSGAPLRVNALAAARVKRGVDLLGGDLLHPVR